MPLQPYYVLSGLLLFASVAHYLYWGHRYRVVRSQLLQDPRVLRRVAGLRAGRPESTRAFTEADDTAGGRRRGKKAGKEEGKAGKEEGKAGKEEGYLTANLGLVTDEELTQVIEVSGWQGEFVHIYIRFDGDCHAR